MSKVEGNKTYIGIVEDNNDPKKLGRVKVRVLDVFDDIPVEDIPWASPWKDLNGNGVNIPEKGKVLTVIFDNGNIYKPEFIFSEHYNVNLEKKLSSLSGSNYTSMKALIFDHKTQIYVNDEEGLKIDYKFNNLNITEGTIDINLKDNRGLVNIGDATAGQQAILGNHWMDWFDEFVDNLLNGPYLGNLMSPVIANPTFIDCLTKYKALRNEVFLSHHVNIVDNNKVSTVRMTERQSDGQLGDDWKSTVQKNDIATKESFNWFPKDGNKPDYDDSYIPPPTDGSPDTTPGDSNIPPLPPLSNPESNKKISKLIRYLRSKNYIVYDEIGVLNIVGMRTKDDGRVTNKFDDILYVFYRNKNGNWDLFEYSITTTPGYKPNTNELPNKVAILKLGQYVDQYKLGFHKNKPDHKCLKYSTSIVHRNDKKNQYNYRSYTEQGEFGINIHRSSSTGSSENVFNYSEGCQVFKNANQFKQFIQLCENQVYYAKKDKFTYTLCRKSEFDAFT
jgi:hypothetical protein